MEAAAERRRADPSKKSDAQSVSRDLCLHDSFSARRSQRRLRAQDVDLEAWEQSTTDGAIEAAGYVASHLRELSGAKEGAADEEALLCDFARRFANRAFRRPLSEDQKELYVNRRFKEAKDPRTALKRVVLLVLKSPRFLYREIGVAEPDAYDTAARISFGLWDSLPDRPLLEAASSGKL